MPLPGSLDCDHDFLCPNGLIYVYRTLQLHDLATEKDRLEKEIVAVPKREMSLAIKSRR